MAGEDADDDDKQFDPSERKLARAREQGDIPRSEDMQTAAGYAGFVMALLLAGGWAAVAAGKAAMVFLDQPDRIARLDQPAGTAEIAGLSLRMAAPLLLLPGGAMAAALLYLVATRSFTLAPGKILPKGSRISILANARQKFGRTGLVEFAKRFAKLAAVSALLVWFLKGDIDAVLLSARLDPGQVAALMADQVRQFLTLFLAVTLAFGLADVLWQRMEFARRNRMTRQEMMDEMKESEGDPHMKAGRRRRAQEIAANRMLVDVAKADVVIVNPTHFAVALTWSRGKGSAPRCVAKGTDEIAARIRERAQENAVPIRRDPPTARAIHATVEIGQEIRIEHYAAVAAAIRFADAMRRKARRR